jgi:hypothetical protein
VTLRHHESSDYNSTNDSQQELPGMTGLSAETKELLNRPASSFKPPAATAPISQEVLNLDEGPVTLTFPSNLTQDSDEELESALKLFLLRQQRRARRGGGQNEEAAN